MISGIEYINSAISEVEQRSLASALEIIRAFLEMNPQLATIDSYDEIRSSYHYMLDYMRKGTKDPERVKLYNQLLYRTFSMLIDLTVDYSVEKYSTFINAYNSTAGKQGILTIAEIRHQLEDFVSSMALTELLSEQEKEEKRNALFDSHQQYMSIVFKRMLIAKHWSESDCEEMKQLLLSPTIESTDRQLIVSGLTLNVLQFFDINKFKLLTDIYTESDDEQIRQRALVGWALTSRPSADKLFPSQRVLVSKMESDSGIRSELLELQEQLVYCDETDRYTDKIQNEIMPDLLKNNKNLNITRFGIEEKDDPMQDIIDPGASDRAMENVEKTMDKMSNMMKQGSDIYFGGFSQMKRYPFFYDISNWFCPFYIEHPGLKVLSQECRDSNLLTKLMESGPFCDSDKFSFALTLDKIFHSIPPQVKEMLGSGDAFGPSFPEEETKKPLYIRRMYLQNIYRFFRLFDGSHDFADVFGLRNPKDKAVDYSNNIFMFLANPIFKHHGISETINQLTTFLIKYKKPFDVQKLMTYDDTEQLKREEILSIKENSSVKRKTTIYYKYLGMQYASQKKWKEAAACFDEYLLGHPDDHSLFVTQMLGPAFIKGGNYRRAYPMYRDFYNENPDNIFYAKNYCLCLSNMDKYQEALDILYKLNYELPNDMNVIRMLAWNTMGIGQLDKSSQYYASLLSSAGVTYQDKMYAGYCHWSQGDIAKAVQLFDTVKDPEDKQTKPSSKWFRNYFTQDMGMLTKNGITYADIELMSDLVAGGI